MPKAGRRAAIKQLMIQTEKIPVIHDRNCQPLLPFHAQPLLAATLRLITGHHALNLHIRVLGISRLQLELVNQ